MKYIKTYENYDLYDNDEGKQYWGNRGCGILPICSKTKRILVSFRSKYVNEGNTWSTWGGKVDGDEDLQNTAKREFEEESGYYGMLELFPAYIFKTQGFEYHNFIGSIPEEFEPDLDWETEAYKWLSLDQLMELEPKHFGLESLLNDGPSMDTIKKCLE